MHTGVLEAALLVQGLGAMKGMTMAKNVGSAWLCIHSYREPQGRCSGAQVSPGNNEESQGISGGDSPQEA